MAITCICIFVFSDEFLIEVVFGVEQVSDLIFQVSDLIRFLVVAGEDWWEVADKIEESMIVEEEDSFGLRLFEDEFEGRQGKCPLLLGLGALDELINKDEAVTMMSLRIIKEVFEWIQFCLESAEFVLEMNFNIDLADHHIKNIGSEALSWNKAAHLCQNCQIPNRT